MTRRGYTLTTAELAALWADLGAGRLPYPLATPGPDQDGRTTADARAGLGPATEPLALLRVLAEHRTRVDAVAHLDRPVRALAATDGRRATLAVVDGATATLVEIRPTALAHAVVGVLPDRPAGPGQALSLRLEALARASTPNETTDDRPWPDAPTDERTALRRAGLSDEDAAAFARLAAHRLGGGQFGITTTTTRKSRCDSLVGWFDTPQGRYLAISDRGWLSLAPADNTRIAARLGSALHAATHDVG